MRQLLYVSNQHTFGVIFEREMMTRANLERRRRTVIDFVLGYLQAPKAIEPASAGRGRSVASLVS
jgi:Tetracyclin repressor-like, C-terminal domain